MYFTKIVTISESQSRNNSATIYQKMTTRDFPTRVATFAQQQRYSRRTPLKNATILRPHPTIRIIRNSTKEVTIRKHIGTLSFENDDLRRAKVMFYEIFVCIGQDIFQGVILLGFTGGLLFSHLLSIGECVRGRFSLLAIRYIMINRCSKRKKNYNWVGFVLIVVGGGGEIVFIILTTRRLKKLADDPSEKFPVTKEALPRIFMLIRVPFSQSLLYVASENWNFEDFLCNPM